MNQEMWMGMVPLTATPKDPIGKSYQARCFRMVGNMLRLADSMSTGPLPAHFLAESESLAQE